MPNPIRIVVADEQPNFLRGLCRVLKNERSLQILADASDAQSAVNVTRCLKPDILLLDLALLRRLALQALCSLVNDTYGPSRDKVLSSIELLLLQRQEERNSHECAILKENWDCLA